MTLYIDKSYFVGEILIPNLTGTSPAHVALQGELTRFIARYEPEFMKYLLGEDFYQDFLDNYDPDTEDEWKDLADQIFRIETDGGETPVEISRLSPVANYIYFHFIRNAKSITTNTIEVQAKTENSDVILSNHKLVKAWNDMVDWMDEIWDYLDESEDFPEYDYSETEELSKLNASGI